MGAANPEQIRSNTAPGEPSWTIRTPRYPPRSPTWAATKPENEACLLNVARHGTAHHIEQMVRNYRRCERQKLLQEERRNHALRELSWYIDEDGCWVMKGHFTPEQGAVIQKALEKAMDEQFEERQDEHSDVAAATRG